MIYDMNYKPFSDQFWQDIGSTLKNLKETYPNQKLVAAFDADGTLWDTDLGENFFNYQIDQKHFALPPDPFQYYLDLKKVNNDPCSAYVWLAQINKGQHIDQVRQWAQQAFQSIYPNPIFSEQKKLIQLFLENKIEVYVVTASIKWAVEPGALALGLPAEAVIGVETAIENGIITDLPVFPITYKQGKVEALMKKTQGTKHFFASGNSMGDFELLKEATHIRLAVSAASRDDLLFKTENELLTQAKNNNWHSHRFI